MNFPILSESNYHKIIAISETEVGKILMPPRFVWVNTDTGQEVPAFNWNMDIDKEIKYLKYANSINDLMVRFIRKDFFEEKTEMLVMERIYPISIQDFSLKKREIFFKKFVEQINELHLNGFIHGDIEHPVRGNPDFLYDNIILTEQGLRLVDTGFSHIEKEETESEFYELLIQEKKEILNFKSYFLG